jgi:hypothetical protein
MDTQYKVVGSNCLSNFFPEDPQNLVALFELVSDALESAGGFEAGGGAESRFGLLHFMGFVAAAVRADGWRSRTTARNMGGSATADDAFGAMLAVATGGVKAEYKPDAAAWARGEAAVNFMSEYLETHGEDNDYLHNLKVVIKTGTLDWKLAGLAASILVTAEREQGKEIERRKHSNLKETSRHLGEVKGKLLGVKATVTGNREMEGSYGVTTLVKFVTSDGCAMTWFASGSVSSEWEMGKEYLLAATVKKHDEYQGLKQTVLTRVVAVTEEVVRVETAKAEKKAKKAMKALVSNP